MDDIIGRAFKFLRANKEDFSEELEKLITSMFTEEEFREAVAEHRFMKVVQSDPTKLHITENYVLDGQIIARFTIESVDNIIKANSEFFVES